MENQPETRFSLIARLNDAQDHEAWVEFLDIYEPLILRMLRRQGLQDSDARDLSQHVIFALSKDIDQWTPDGREASFRRWLFRIARNRVLKFLVKEKKKERATGGTDAGFAIEQQQDDRASISDVFEKEHQQQLLMRAAEKIRGEFQDSTWQAFWLSHVDGKSIAEVVEELNVTAGSVYVSRSRVVARLRSKVNEILGEEEGHE